MKFKVSEIPEGRHEYQFERPLSWLESTLPQHEGDFVHPAGPLALRFSLDRRRRNVRLRGEARLAISFTCVRCGADGTRELVVELNETFIPAHTSTEPESPVKRKIDLTEEDFASQIYVDDALDLERYVADSIVLAYPDFPVCDDNPACAEGAGTYTEDWGVDEASLNVNPIWKESLLEIKGQMAKKPRSAKAKKPRA